MRCMDCYWCTLNHPLSNEYVCCKNKSEKYNKLLSKKEIQNQTDCLFAESEESIDYRKMNPWEFAKKYYE